MERSQLYKSIWNICQKIKGGMDSSEMKNYIFTIMFYRYISESFTNWFNKPEIELGNLDFDYANLKDNDEVVTGWKEQAIKEKGYFILPSQLFKNIHKKTKYDRDLVDNMNRELQDILRKIEDSAMGHESENDIKGLMTRIDWNDHRLGDEVRNRGEKIVEIMNAVHDMKFNFEQEEYTIDILGDVYEYLMGEYAQKAGKKGGEFYTPPEVSELLAKIIIGKRKSIKSVYDPTCGSGSLLLKFAKTLGEKNIGCLYGQEIINTTYNLCRMNMFLHGINYHKFDIQHGDTLMNPKHITMKFDAIVSNPPYSAEWAGEGNVSMATDSRFEPIGAIAPADKADWAFIAHVLYQLSNNGKAAIVCATGVLTRLQKEQTIRQWFINQNYIESVIYLASNLFYGTSINTAVLVLNKAKADKDILFIDASRIFTKKQGKRNELSEEDINQILELYENREDKEFLAKRVSNEEVEKNKWDLGIKTYIQQQEEKEEIDIKVLNKDIDETVSKIDVLRANINQIIKEIEEQI